MLHQRKAMCCAEMCLCTSLYLLCMRIGNTVYPEHARTAGFFHHFKEVVEIIGAIDKISASQKDIDPMAA